MNLKHSKECKKLGIDTTIDFKKYDTVKKSSVLKIENQIKNLDMKIADHYSRAYDSQIFRFNNFIQKFSDIQIDCSSNVHLIYYLTPPV